MSSNLQVNDKPKPATVRPFAWRVFVWIVDILVVLAVVAVFVRNPFEFAALNHLYYLGQKDDWQQVHERLGRLPESYRTNPKYRMIRLETLLHLSRNSDAMDFIRSQKAAMDSREEKYVPFQQLAGFAFLLDDRDKDALALFARHSGDSLSRQMTRLLQNNDADQKPDSLNVSGLKVTISREMVFPELYSAVVQYLQGREHLRKGRFSDAAALLEEVCDQYPYEFVFQRDLGMALMQMRRIDTSGIHFLAAWHLLNRPALYRPSPSELADFQNAVFGSVLKNAESRWSADFWRIVRCMESVLPDRAVMNRLRVRPHPLSATELWEWSQFVREYDPETWQEQSSGSLSTQDKSVLKVFDAITSSPPARLRSFPIDVADRCTSQTVLEVMPISRKVSGLVHDGDSVEFKIPSAAGNVQWALVLCQVRGSLRRGIPGSCGIEVGMDQYWLSPSDKPRWYALALPLLTEQPVRLRFEFGSDSVAGFTEKGDMGDRNLYVQNILACYLKAR